MNQQRERAGVEERPGHAQVFVFGSNLAGRHGAGAAKFAVEHHGAIYGVGQGRQGNSYGIPTKDERIRTLPLARIAEYVRVFMYYAAKHPEERFQVTRIGCGLAGYRDEDIAPLFTHAPSNCSFDPAWTRFGLPSWSAHASRLE